MTYTPMDILKSIRRPKEKKEKKLKDYEIQDTNPGDKNFPVDIKE